MTLLDWPIALVIKVRMKHNSLLPGFTHTLLLWIVLLSFYYLYTYISEKGSENQEIFSKGNMKVFFDGFFNMSKVAISAVTAQLFKVS